VLRFGWIAAAIFVGTGRVAAAEPVLGPAGWMVFGPAGPSGGPELDPADCTVGFRRLLLDAGPETPELRAELVWDHGQWMWSADWRIEPGGIRRPGRHLRPVGPGLQANLDTAGRVVAIREGGGPLVTLQRDASGRLSELSVGDRWIRIEDERVLSNLGREARVRWEAGRPVSAVDANGVRTVLAHDGAELSEVTWPEGRIQRLLPGGIVTSEGRWTCRGGAGSTTVTAPGGARWRIETSEDRVQVVDPTGGVTRSDWNAGRLSGWQDPRGGEARVLRDDAGRPTGIDDPGSAIWTLRWGAGGLTGVVQPDAGAWVISRDGPGEPTGVTDPTGSRRSVELSSSGRVRALRLGERSARLSEGGGTSDVHDGGGGTVRLRRGPDGRTEAVTDGAGGVWSFGRDRRGRIVAIHDPTGAGWSLRRDGLGAVREVVGPDGLTWAAIRRQDGRIVELRQGEDRWALLRRSDGSLSAVRDALGRTTGWDRDGLGRIRSLLRADGSGLGVVRDAAGDVTGLGDVRVRRGPDGQASSLELGEGGKVTWDRDADGRVTGVTGVGVALSLQRDSAGRINSVDLGGDRLALQRDGAGEVVAAGRTRIDRDRGGRAIRVAGPAAPELALSRDARGLVFQLVMAGRTWRWGRDAAARVLTATAPDGAYLGADRDRAGRVRLLRDGRGFLATVTTTAEGADLRLQDPGGASLGEVAWSLDPSGRVSSRRAGESAWTMRRDPLGHLVASEGSGSWWSATPGVLEGPAGYRLESDASVRPVTVRSGDALARAWGLVGESARYALDAHARIAEIAATNGSVGLSYDALSRMQAWRGPGGRVSVSRDDTGALLAVGGDPARGWGIPLQVGERLLACIPGVGCADRGGASIVGSDGVPVATLSGEPLVATPSGVVVDGDARGQGPCARLAVGKGGPLLGLLDGVDPLSGRLLAPGLAWPWGDEPPGPCESSPWPDPDFTGASPTWDPAPWAPDSPWANPIAIVAEADALPRYDPLVLPAGLPWLPVSLAPASPELVPGRVTIMEEPLVLWVLSHALAPATPASAEDLACWLWAAEVGAELLPVPGLDPELPLGFAGAPCRRARPHYIGLAASPGLTGEPWWM
jgi:YD repeat-containing protein